MKIKICDVFFFTYIQSNCIYQLGMYYVICLGFGRIGEPAQFKIRESVKFGIQN